MKGLDDVIKEVEMMISMTIRSGLHVKAVKTKNGWCGPLTLVVVWDQFGKGPLFSLSTSRVEGSSSTTSAMIARNLSFKAVSIVQ